MRKGPEKTFFVVWNPDRGLPRYQHDTLEQAQKEAERLAGMSNGEVFVVMQAIGYARSINVEYRPLDEIPF